MVQLNFNLLQIFQKLNLQQKKILLIDKIVIT